VPSGQLRVVERFEVGQKVEANYGGRGLFYRGVIVGRGGGRILEEAEPSGCQDGGEVYDVEYEDGDKETGVSRQLIR
jgi:hypothetical protein